MPSPPKHHENTKPEVSRGDRDWKVIIACFAAIAALWGFYRSDRAEWGDKELQYKMELHSKDLVIERKNNVIDSFRVEFGQFEKRRNAELQTLNDTLQAQNYRLNNLRRR